MVTFSRRRALSFAAAVVSVAALAASARAADAPVVAAASDLKFALEEIAAKFRTESGRDLRLTFGSSGNFARQIEQGAPFEIFLSADEEYVIRLADKGLVADRGQLYAIGRIALVAGRGSPLRLDAGLDGLREALERHAIKRFAIANPEHAPYGRAAEQALRHAGLWDRLLPTLVLGENVSQAAQFATSGAAQGGIVAYSLALAPALSQVATYVLLPAEWHRPLNQRMALVRNAGETARAFYAYLGSQSARAVFVRFGFALPGEAS